ncbi:MAG: hypothetical protein KDJ41_13125 [Hyphomicrobiaceae bacterium]|nr:hypothetical protein [Hyphomicrobiaceae bacterium]
MTSQTSKGQAAGPGKLSAAEAHRRQAAGELVLVDIRTPGEWLKTGLPAGAVALTPTGPEFLDQVEAALDGDRTRPLALICASGMRSAQLQMILEARGFTGVVDVSEGMLGNRSAGPGWIAGGLPIVPYRG